MFINFYYRNIRINFYDDPDPNKKRGLENDILFSQLVEVVKENDYDKLEELLESGEYDIAVWSYCSIYGPLINMAIRYSSYKCLVDIIDHCKRLDNSLLVQLVNWERESFTALSDAIVRQDFSYCKILLDHGGNLLGKMGNFGFEFFRAPLSEAIDVVCSSVRGHSKEEKLRICDNIIKGIEYEFKRVNTLDSAKILFLSLCRCYCVVTKRFVDDDRYHNIRDKIVIDIFYFLLGKIKILTSEWKFDNFSYYYENKGTFDNLISIYSKESWENRNVKYFNILLTHFSNFGDYDTSWIFTPNGIANNRKYMDRDYGYSCYLEPMIGIISNPIIILRLKLLESRPNIPKSNIQMIDKIKNFRSSKSKPRHLCNFLNKCYDDAEKIVRVNNKISILLFICRNFMPFEMLEIIIKDYHRLMKRELKLDL